MLRIILDGDGAIQAVYPNTPADRVVRAELGAITALGGGMASALPSVGFLAALPDGRVVFSETSLRLFLIAAAAFRARYGDPR